MHFMRHIKDNVPYCLDESGPWVKILSTKCASPMVDIYANHNKCVYLSLKSVALVEDSFPCIFRFNTMIGRVCSLVFIHPVGFL